MLLQFLGTGGYHPNARRHTACILLPEVGVVFDAGTAAFRIRERLRTPDLQIFLTHAHLDHVVGLTYFLVPMLQGTPQHATVYSTQPYLDDVRQHLFSQGLFPVLPGFDFEVLKPQVSVPGGGIVTHATLNHPGGALGFRVTWPDRSMAYITDTTVDGSYVDFIRGVDVLIHECQFPDDMAAWSGRTGHSNTTPVATLARDAGVGQLWLTHIDPLRPDDDPIGLAVARAIFPATELAEDLLEIDF